MLAPTLTPRLSAASGLRKASCGALAAAQHGLETRLRSSTARQGGALRCRLPREARAMRACGGGAAAARGGGGSRVGCRCRRRGGTGRTSGGTAACTRFFTTIKTYLLPPRCYLFKIYRIPPQSIWGFVQRAQTPNGQSTLAHSHTRHILSSP